MASILRSPEECCNLFILRAILIQDNNDATWAACTLISQTYLSKRHEPVRGLLLQPIFLFNHIMFRSPTNTESIIDFVFAFQAVWAPCSDSGLQPCSSGGGSGFVLPVGMTCLGRDAPSNLSNVLQTFFAAHGCAQTGFHHLQPSPSRHA